MSSLNKYFQPLHLNLPKRNKFDTKKKIIVDYEHKYIQNEQFGYKPNGFWYGCHNGWYNYIIKNKLSTFLHKYIHQINIYKNAKTNIQNKDKNKLLVIKSKKDLHLFEQKYGKSFDHIMGPDYLINWHKVAKQILKGFWATTFGGHAKHYGGIEICPFYKSKKYNTSWLDTFDAASGCVWNIKPIIKNTKLIYILQI